MIQVAVVLREWKEKSFWILRLCQGDDSGLPSGPGKGTKPASRRRVLDSGEEEAQDEVIMKIQVCVLALAVFLTPAASADHHEQEKSEILFDGKSLEGWNVNKGEEKWWKVAEGAIEGGSLTEHVPHNTFCVSDKSYSDFELNLKFRITPVKGGINSGIQIRSERIKNHHEMIGYQADAAKNYWGKIYDESRRRKVISKVLDPGALAKAVKPDGWNHYRILCEGPRIRMWLNGVACADYTEKDATIPLEGYIGLQVHGGGTLTVRFKDITVRELTSSKSE